MKTKMIHAAGLALAILGAAQVSWGQVQQLQLGRPTDANPMVGGGGSNQPMQGYVPINGNDVITGNVSGLKYFHGNVGSSSPYTFQGNLGTSSLSNFARQSAGNGMGGGAIGQSFYLPSQTVSTAQGAVFSAPFNGGFESRLVPPTAISPVISGAQLQSIAPSEGQVTVGQVSSFAYDRGMSNPLKPGTPGAVLSSPLFTMRLDEMLQRQALEGRNGLAPTTGPSTTLPSGEMRPISRNDTVAQRATGREDPRVTGQSTELMNASRTPIAKPEQDIRIGDTYRTLASDLQKAEEEASRSEEVTGNGVQPIRGSNLQTDIDPLTGYPRKVATIRNSGGRAGPTTGPTTGPANAMVQDPRKNANVPSGRLDELPLSTLQAGSKVKPLTTFVKPTEEKKATTEEALLGQGEQAMKLGKFMEAADAYQQVIAQDPGNVLALVGRAHAEMGAGMFQSAAYDLKFAYTRNPQMISVRYDLGSFIPLTRQDSLMRELTKMASGKDPGNVGSFLVCYLDYQLGRNAQLQAELKAWAAKDDKDSWRTVAQRAWLGSEAPASAPAKQP